MINIPLSFGAMWAIMFAGILTTILADINKINHDSPDSIPLSQVVSKFFKKEWAAYGMSVIFTGIVAFSFQYMKQFDNSNNEEISKWGKWIPLAVIILYFFGVVNQWAFYKVLGRIKTNGKVDVDLLKNKPDNNGN